MMEQLDDLERLRRLFRVKTTEIEMMLDRGYRLDTVHIFQYDKFKETPFDLTSLNTPGFRFEEFLKFREDRGIFQSRQNFSSIYYKDNDRILILYLNNDPGKQVSKKDFQIVLSFIQTQIYRHIILITETGLNSDNNNFVTSRTTGYKIEVFLDSDLAFNVTKHALAPISIQHIKSKDTAQYSQKEQIQPEKIPMIMDSDAIARHYGSNAFDVFQMVTMGANTDTTGSYRLCRQTPIHKK
jgi:DNA-directed RNA polymerase subunit H (RpoH/RPB5)